MTDFAVGVIGAGAVFRRLYAPAIEHCGGIRLVCVADPAVPTVAGAKVYASADTMIEAETVDGVIVLSPPALHAAHVALSAGRGLRTLVEKPPALTAAEVDAWPRPELITPGFSRRYDKRYTRPVLAGHRWQFTLQTDPRGWGARTAEPVERDLLPHAADLACWLTGEAISSEDDIQRSKGGAAGSFLLSSGGRFDWEVRHGDEHIERLTLDGKELATEKLGVLERMRLRVTRAQAADVVGIGRLIRHWIGDSSTAGLPPLATVTDARACAAVIEAVERVPLGAG